MGALEDAAEAADDVIDELAGAPEDGRISRFTWQGATLVAEERGAGEPVFLLVHGIGMGRRVFADVAVHLAERGRAIAIDQPGYGEAPEPPRTPSIERVADLVAAFIRDRRLERPVLIGHSMGTQVVAEIAARHPDLAGPVVLVAPTVDSEARRAVPQLLRLGRDLLGESLKVLVLGAREYLRAGPNLRRKMKAMLSHRPEEAYERIRSRTLVVRGANDVVCPPVWVRRVAELVPDATSIEIPGHGHETMIRDGAPAAERILAWLDRG
ncbi:dihydrolipoamide acetyltransferase [Microbacterium barkeri]|uniref:Dihydrolipoamide acetyltransferase n=1 Tax=Microbacterium barkeri TaxID=33917 RepID=A0A9W6LY19_9MICO|nr:alpha/beta hydrolase [Microbacterium barkeri]MDR6878006.1 pimeloyl-ACP methyl ester carboxylesterase [Microbacterium barkeri]GLJ63042.1 dihydrolipoamide acetyltransferase [Microbacterium barkeri]